MVAVESFAERLQRLRVARGLSERELAARMGITLHQYQSLAGAGAIPTCALLMDLSEALDAPVSDLTESIIESPPTREQMRAFLQELRERRAPIDRRVAAFRRAFGSQWLREMDIDASAALLDAVERKDTLRAWARRYVQLVVERCGGSKAEACRVLGIHYHTLRAYLRGKGGSPRTGEERATGIWSDVLADPAEDIYTLEDGKPVER